MDRALIFYEPTRKETFVYALPVADDDHGHIPSHFGDAPCFRLITVRLKDRTVTEERIVKNFFGTVDHGKGILVAELLNKHAIDAVLTRESFEGRVPFMCSPMPRWICCSPGKKRLPLPWQILAYPFESDTSSTLGGRLYCRPQ